MAVIKRIAYFADAALPPDAGAALALVAGFIAIDGKVYDLDKPGEACNIMRPYWERVADIVAGTDAIRAGREKYLPRLPEERAKSYSFRLSVSKFTNIYRDVLENLASKPFETPITIKDAPTDIETFSNDVDGSGRSLSMFAIDTFFNGINDALDWIFVDYPTSGDLPAVRTVKDEKLAGLRPFWSRVCARNVLDVRSALVNGKELLSYMRIHEPDVNGTNFVRILARDATGARWELWREVGDGQITAGRRTRGQAKEFIKDSDGVFTIGVIPLVPFITGRRNGRKWSFAPPMRDAADLQIKLYQDESGLDHIKTLAAFPMLAANGVSPPKGADGKAAPNEVPVGPMVVLWAPPDGKGTAGKWELLEPAATTLTFLAADIEATKKELRELGRNPLTAQSGNLTVITTAVAAKKGNSAVQLWANQLAETLEQALIITAQWMTIAYLEPEVQVFTDFDVDGDGSDELTALNNMRTGRDISQKTLWHEMQRRNILSADFDPDTEAQNLLDETPGPDDGMADPGVDPITGLPIKPPAFPMLAKP